ncbi:hypothetical protein, variant [Capsaspora owczarzaki ATCC 30864]|nr:hypothetical protein, variant [Capsaspora owczarzaki ATCC 30864]
MLLHDFAAPLVDVFLVSSASGGLSSSSEADLTAGGLRSGNARPLVASSTIIAAVDQDARLTLFQYVHASHAWVLLGSFNSPINLITVTSPVRVAPGSTIISPSATGTATAATTHANTAPAAGTVLSATFHWRSRTLVWCLYDPVSLVYSVNARSLVADSEQSLVHLGPLMSVVQRSPYAFRLFPLKSAVAMAVMQYSSQTNAATTGTGTGAGAALPTMKRSNSGSAVAAIAAELGASTPPTTSSNTATDSGVLTFHPVAFEGWRASRRLLLWTPRMATEALALELFVWGRGIVPERVTRTAYVDIHVAFDRFESSPTRSDPVPDVMSFVVHRTTGELLAVASNWSVWVIRNDDHNNGWVSLPLSSLAVAGAISAAPFSSPSPVAGQESAAAVPPSATSPVQLLVLHFMIGLVENGACTIFSLADGSQLSRVAIPYTMPVCHVWHGQGMVPRAGLWGEHGVWQLQSKAVVDQAEILASAASTASTTAPTSAAIQSPAPQTPLAGQAPFLENDTKKMQHLRRAKQLCEQWGLRRLHAKYLFDIAYACLHDASTAWVSAHGHQQHEMVQTQLSVLSELFASRVLGSPALVLALVGADSPVSQILVSELDQFLNAFVGKKGTRSFTHVEDSAMNESAWLLARNAFHLRTPLSSSLSAMLEEYAAWARLRLEVLNAEPSAAQDSALEGSSSASASTAAERQSKLLLALNPLITSSANAALQERMTEAQRLLVSGDIDFAAGTVLAAGAAGSGSAAAVSGGGGDSNPSNSGANPSSSGGAGATTTSTNTFATKGRLLDLDRGKFEHLIRNAPLATLECVIEWLDLSSALDEFAVADPNNPSATSSWPHGTQARTHLDKVFAPERLHGLVLEGESVSRSPRHPLFEITCRLLLLHRPAHLNAFVRLSHHHLSMLVKGNNSAAAMASPMRQYAGVTIRAGGVTTVHPHYYRRAMACLLPMMAPANLQELSRESVMALVELLCSNYLSAAPVALRFLLLKQMYDEAFELLSDRSKQDVEHFELFHVLFAALLDNNLMRRYGSQLWNLAPRNFGVYELLNVLQCHFQQQQRGSNHRTSAVAAAVAAATSQTDSASGQRWRVGSTISSGSAQPLSDALVHQLGDADLFSSLVDSMGMFIVPTRTPVGAPTSDPHGINSTTGAANAAADDSAAWLPDPRAGLSVDLFRPQLLKIFARMKERANQPA